MKITVDLDKHKNEDNTWKETTAKAVEHLTGKQFSEVISEAEAKEKPEIPEGKPSQWNLKKKLDFINEHGEAEFKRIVDERK